jgi:hypothetical protein
MLKPYHQNISFKDARVLFVGGFWPNAHLNLTYVSLAQHPFVKSINTNASANGIDKFLIGN